MYGFAEMTDDDNYTLCLLEQCFILKAPKVFCSIYICEEREDSFFPFWKRASVRDREAVLFSVLLGQIAQRNLPFWVEEHFLMKQNAGQFISYLAGE